MIFFSCFNAHPLGKGFHYVLRNSLHLCLHVCMYVCTPVTPKCAKLNITKVACMLEMKVIDSLY